MRQLGFAVRVSVAIYVRVSLRVIPRPCSSCLHVQCFVSPAVISRAQKELVLLHSMDTQVSMRGRWLHAPAPEGGHVVMCTQLPSGTMAWLAVRPWCARHHHLRSPPHIIPNPRKVRLRRNSVLTLWLCLCALRALCRVCLAVTPPHWVSDQ
jgi:hypothetical protein